MITCIHHCKMNYGWHNGDHVTPHLIDPAHSPAAGEIVLTQARWPMSAAAAHLLGTEWQSGVIVVILWSGTFGDVPRERLLWSQLNKLLKPLTQPPTRLLESPQIVDRDSPLFAPKFRLAQPEQALDCDTCRSIYVTCVHKQVMPHCCSNIRSTATPRLGCEVDFRYEEPGRNLCSVVGSGTHAMLSLEPLTHSVVANMLLLQFPNRGSAKSAAQESAQVRKAQLDVDSLS